VRLGVGMAHKCFKLDIPASGVHALTKQITAACRSAAQRREADADAVDVAGL
jgi:hypothetical protein